MLNWYHDDGWHYREDPYGIIPVGYTSNLCGKVLGFCSPAGKRWKRLMVVVTRGNSYTTMRYPDVLRDRRRLLILNKS